MKQTLHLTSEAIEADEAGLDEEQRQLLQETRSYLPQAYAPYSRFHVAAIALLEDGTRVAGTNQENAAYPSGLCAERVALFHAGALHPGKAIRYLCITVKSESRKVTKPVSPCGACLQVMTESEYRQQKPFTLILAGEEGNILLITGTKNLLPFRFLPDEL